jgi:hypothetical protein
MGKTLGMAQKRSNKFLPQRWMQINWSAIAFHGFNAAQDVIA